MYCVEAAEPSIEKSELDNGRGTLVLVKLQWDLLIGGGKYILHKKNMQSLLSDSVLER